MRGCDFADTQSAGCRHDADESPRPSPSSPCEREVMHPGLKSPGEDAPDPKSFSRSASRRHFSALSRNSSDRYRLARRGGVVDHAALSAGAQQLCVVVGIDQHLVSSPR